MQIIYPLKIGSLLLKNNLILSPMAQITNSAFRRLCIKGGAGLVISEMVSAEGLKYGNKKSLEMLKISEEEHPIAVQIFGSNPQAMANAAIMAQERGADIIDINASCPVKKIMRTGSGAMLMKNEKLLSEIVSEVVKSVKVPVMVKIRSGFNENEITSVRLSKIIEESGASAITLHARPVSNMHSGPVNQEALERTSSSVRIPVIGNGGVKSYEDVKRMIETGCRGVSIGRAAIGEPEIFDRIMSQAQGMSLKIIPPEEKIKKFLKFVSLNVELYGEPHGIVRTRKVIGFWLKNIPNSSFFRARFMYATTLHEVESIFSKI